MLPVVEWNGMTLSEQKENSVSLPQTGYRVYTKSDVDIEPIASKGQEIE
jgi:hypothetical protein